MNSHTIYPGDRYVLLVEDNPDDAELTVRAFAKNRLATVEVVTDGEAALDFLFRTGAYSTRPAGPAPDVVLLDLNIPKIDGLGVLKRLRADEHTRHVPVVVLTSSNEESDIIRSYDLGANSFVRKPVDFEAFLDAARQLGLYWLVLNQPSPAARSPSRESKRSSRRRSSRT